MPNVYQLLRDYRKSKGITQTFIAKKLGKPLSRISALETGTLRLMVDEFVEICINGYEVSPAIFFDDRFSINENDKQKKVV